MHSFRRALSVLFVFASTLSTVTATSLSADPLLKAAWECFDVGKRQNIKAVYQSAPRSVAVGDLNGDGRPDLVVAAPGTNAPVDSAKTVSVLLANPFPQTVQPPFLPETLFATGTGPYGVTLADMNHDGRPDVITANATSNTVSVLLGDGTGKFGAHFDAATDLGPIAIAVADLNGDTNLDVVTANGNTGTISVLFGLGNGGLGPKTDYAAGLSPIQLTIARLNGDSSPDLVVVNGTEDFISVYLNNGSGGFGSRTDVVTAGNPLSVAAGLLNGDGFTDLVVGTGDSFVSVYPGTGTGAFLSRTDYPLTGYGYSTVLDDLNGDTKLDVGFAMVGGTTGDQDVAVLFGDGAGALAPPAYYDAGPGISSMASADLDGDGDHDLVVAHCGPSPFNFTSEAHTIGVLRNNGVGTFGLAISQDPGLSPSQSVSADFNGDGILDIAVTGASPSAFGVKIHRGIGDGTFAAPTFFALVDSGLSIGAADYNRNGTVDLVVGTASAIYAFPGTGNGTFGVGALVASAQGFDGELNDLNRDGIPDVTTFSGNNVFVRLGAGNGAFAAPKTVTAVGPVLGVAVGDLDRNGIPDLVISTASGLSVRLGTGAGNFSVGTDYSGMFSGKPVIADFNLDGKLDVAACDNGNSSGFAPVGMTLFFGSGTGLLTRDLTFPTLDVPVVAAAADMNRDGKLDLLAWTPGNLERPGTVSLLEGNGSGTFSARQDYGAGPVAGRLLMGDYNRDGRPDVALATRNYGSQPRLKVLRGNAPGTFGSFSAKVDYTGPTGELAVAVGDVNRDGRLDAIVIGPNGSTGRVGVCLGNGLGGLGAPTYFTTGQGPVAVAVADLDLDGDLDLAIACTGTVSVEVFRGDGTGSFIPFGGDIFVDDIPTAIAVGDLIRDGYPDIVTVNEAGNDATIIQGFGGGFTLYDLVAVSSGPRSVAVADINRDGELDFVTANGASGDVGVFYGSGGVFAQTMIGPFVGLAPTSVAVGDFNRDGVPDLAVTHETSGSDMVGVLRGIDGNTFFPPVDYPVPDLPQSVAVSDVDRDGDDDLVVASRSANLVSVLMGSGTGGFASRVDYATGTLPGSVAIGDLNLDGRPDILVSNATSANTSVLLNTGSVVTGVEAQAPAAPRVGSLAQNTPNPFNPRTAIRFHLDVAGHAQLMVFDVSGRRVATLIDRKMPAGDGRVEWDGRDNAGHAVASGVYFYRLEEPGFSDSRAMVLLR